MMKIFLIILMSCFFTSSKLFANSLLPLCSLELLCKHLKEEKSSPIPFLTKNSKLSSDRLKKIFSENRILILELLNQKKGQIPPAEFPKLVNAILTVRLGSFEEPPLRKIFPGACDRPNAIYISGMHRILICPSLLNYPDLTLQQILAHELGHVIQDMQNYISCFNNYPKAQRDEVFADWVAAKVLAEKIASERNKIIAEKQAFESQLLFLNLACNNPKIKIQAARTHPNLQNRIERIFLTQPAFQEALRCQAKDPKTCG
ncbi:MAG: hypothetical protein ACXVB1_00915 [Pseudobdellovibrionaceae bacterium]